MPLVDPYAPCPCGSEKKFKWCCQKVEIFAERAIRLQENGQFDGALAAIHEGLSKFPSNPWLLLRKAMVQIAQQKPEEARQSLAAVLRETPDHLAAIVLQTRLVLLKGDAVAAASEFQHALARVDPKSRPRLFRVIAFIASALGEDGFFPAAFKHYELALRFDHDEKSMIVSALRSLKSSPRVSRWLKTAYSLADAPEASLGPSRQQFDQALSWGKEGLWQAAAAAFDLLTSDPIAGPLAERNHGLCRLWLGDEPAAVAALRRWLERAAPTTDAVDLAVLCHAIGAAPDPDPIEHVQLSWPLRDRGALLLALGGQPTLIEGPKRHLDPEDEESPEVDCYYWLDRPVVEARPGLSLDQIPLIQANLLIGPETVVLETDDDGRLNALVDRFTALAGKAVPPAHPRTKVIGQSDRSQHALSWHWFLPPELSEDEKQRLTHEQMAHLVTTVWPETPVTSFGGRTPLQLARSGTSEILLRAAVLGLEYSGEDWGGMVDWQSLRSRLGIPPEPAIDPETVDIDRVPVCRLAMIPLRRVDDDRLLNLYRRAFEWGLVDLRLEAAHEIVSRPGIDVKGRVDAITLYGDLAIEAAGRDDRASALQWLGRGRAADGTSRTLLGAANWDMLELQIKASLDSPEVWVPELLVILERYRGNEEASTAVTGRLISMGLVNIVSAADRPGEFMVDSRPLQQLLSLYGPKVTTAGGYLGVSATRGEIWTPETASKGSPIWTPGSDLSGAGTGERSKLIFPGQ
jgi:tetratricopeptide (TPR) repeat protein